MNKPTGKGSRVYIAAIVSQIHLMVTKVTTGDEDRMYAALDLSYDLDSLQTLSLLLKGMTDNKIVPTVYIWNDDTPRTEIAVIFSLTNPPKDILRALVPYTGSLPTHVDRIIATGEADIESPSVHEFLARYERDKSILVLVSEHGGTLGDVDSLVEFVVTDIRRHQPS